MKREIELDMPKSLKHQLDDDFEDVFVDELQQQSGRLPLQNFTAEGGWPDDDSLHIAVDAIELERGRVLVTAALKFDEVLPTGCADLQRSESAFGKLGVVLDLTEGRAFISYEDDF